MKKKLQLIPLLNFFAETLRETLEERDVSQAEVSRMTGIPSPHLTDMKKSIAAVAPRNTTCASAATSEPLPASGSASSWTTISCAPSARMASGSNARSSHMRHDLPEMLT